MSVVIGIGLVVLWAVSGSCSNRDGWVVLLGALLLAAFHTLVRRRPCAAAARRDTASFAHGWAGKLLVAVVLVAVPVAMVLTSVGGGRYGRYADDSWKALLMLVVLAGSYLASRRLVLTVLIGAVTVAVVLLGVVPDLAVARNGDPTVLAHLDQQAGRAGWTATTPSPSPRSTWTRPSRCGWPASAPTTRPRWRSGR